MSVAWSWGFEIGASSSVYVGSGWTISRTASVLTDVLSSARAGPLPASGIGGGIYSCKCSGSQTIRTPVLSATPTSLTVTKGWVSFFLYKAAENIDNYDSANSLFHMYNDVGNTVLTVVPTSDSSSTTYKLLVSGTLVGTTSTSFSTNTWYHLAVKFDISTATASAGLWVDGASEIAYSPIVAPATKVGSLSFRGGKSSVPSGDCSVYYDNIVLYDSLTDTGNTKKYIQGFRPNGDVTTTAWGQSVGTLVYPCALTASWSAKFISNSIVNSPLVFDIQDLSSVSSSFNPANIDSVQAITMTSRNTNIFSAQTKIGTNVNSNYITGPATPVTSSAVIGNFCCVIANINPEDSGSWTALDINNIRTAHVAF